MSLSAVVEAKVWEERNKHRRSRPTPLPLPVREGSIYLCKWGLYVCMGDTLFMVNNLFIVNNLSNTLFIVYSCSVITPLPHREGQGGGSWGALCVSMLVSVPLP